MREKKGRKEGRKKGRGSNCEIAAGLKTATTELTSSLSKMRRFEINIKKKRNINQRMHDSSSSGVAPMKRS